MQAQATGRWALRAQTSVLAPEIVPGDELTVHAQDAAEPGQIVVISVNGEATLKRYDGSDGYTILGVVKSLYREFK